MTAGTPRRSSPLALLVVVVAVFGGLGLAVASCRGRGPDDVPEQPTSVAMIQRDGVTPGVTGPRARPTWTLPPGVGQSIDAPPAGPPSPSPQATRAIGAEGPPLVDPEIAALMSQVDPDRLVGDVEALASFGTRHVLSVADDPGRGIGGARQWVYGRFDAANRQGSNQVAVEWEPFDLAFGGRTTEQRNVLATIPGLDRPKRFVYVVAHYDSRTVDSADGGSAAPGADDDASGVAALTELARVLATRQWKASIRLAAFAAGEAGSEGSQHHASRAAEFGLPILAVLEDQSIGGAGGPGAPDGGSVSVYAPAGAAPGEGLARYVAAVGQRYVPLEVVIVPEAATADGPGVQAVFGDAGFPAAQIAAGSADVATEHTAGDTADRLDPEYLAQVVRLNAALVANLALAPPGVTQAPAISVVPDGTQVGWQPVEHPDVAGYWIGLRAAGEARYRPLVWAGSGNETTVEAPSGWLVAVAASDDRGHVSPFSPEAEVP